MNFRGLCGGGNASEETVRGIKPPPSTETYFPVSFDTGLNVLEMGLQERGLQIKDKAFCLANDDKRLFGLYNLNGETQKEDYSLALALRMSLDKSFAITLSYGQNVFVCANLQISGEFIAHRKNTRFAERDLPGKVFSLLNNCLAQYENEHRLIELWKDRTLAQSEVESILWKSTNILPYQFVKKNVVPELRNQRFSHQGERNVWGLNNCFSFAQKKRFEKNPHMGTRESIELNKLFKNLFPLPKEQVLEPDKVQTFVGIEGELAAI